MTNKQTRNNLSPVSGHQHDREPKAFIEKKGFKRAAAALYLGISTITIDRLTKRGLLHASRAVRHPIYSKDDFDRFLRETSGSIDRAE